MRFSGLNAKYGKIPKMENGKTRSPEDEIREMTLVVGAAFPKGWQARMYWNPGWPTSKDNGGRAVVAIERFDGVTWREHARIADSGLVLTREKAFVDLLSNWASRGSWTEDVKYWGGRIVRLPCPPAGSLEELCMKLTLMEGA